jgi:hypothetical protein
MLLTVEFVRWQTLNLYCDPSKKIPHHCYLSKLPLCHADLLSPGRKSKEQLILLCCSL